MIRKDGMVIMSEEEYLGIKTNDYKIKYEELVIKNAEDLQKLECYRNDYEELLNFLPKIVARENQTTDVRLSRKDFIKLHKYGVEQMDFVSENFTAKNNLVYNNNISVHWMGYYCDCLDGAQPANYIFPAIKELDDEMEGEEFDYE